MVIKWLLLLRNARNLLGKYMWKARCHSKGKKYTIVSLSRETRERPCSMLRIIYPPSVIPAARGVVLLPPRHLLLQRRQQRIWMHLAPYKKRARIELMMYVPPSSTTEKRYKHKNTLTVSNRTRKHHQVKFVLLIFFLLEEFKEII